MRGGGGGVSKAFSKSNMKVSTWPWLSKILAQSSITVKAHAAKYHSIYTWLRLRHNDRRDNSNPHSIIESNF